MSLIHACSFLILTSTAIILQSTGAKAATIQVTSTLEGAECNLRMTGDIKEGDLQNLKDIEGQVRVWGRRLCLGSSGGSFIEGLRIAKYLISEAAFHTVIEDGAQCLSACALIFMGGHSHIAGEESPGRHLHIRGRLGFHSPFPDWSSLPDVRYTKADMKQFYDAALQSSQLLINTLNVTAHNKDRADKVKWVKASLINVLLSTPPDKLFYIDTVGKAGNWDIDVYGHQRISTLDDTMIQTACTNRWYWAADVYSAEAAIKYNGVGIQAGHPVATEVSPGLLRFTMDMYDRGSGADCTIAIRAKWVSPSLTLACGSAGKQGFSSDGALGGAARRGGERARHQGRMCPCGPGSRLNRVSEGDTHFGQNALPVDMFLKARKLTRWLSFRSIPP